MRKTVRRFFVRLASSVTRHDAEQRLREEIDEHLALQTADYIRAGMSPAEARRRALLKFGPAQTVLEQYRDAERLPAIESFLQDARYTFRQFAKAPVVMVTAIFSLALGIGANTAVFAVIEHVFMRALPVSDPQELVFVADQRSQEEQSPRFSYPFYAALRDNQVLSGTAARFKLPLNATIAGQPGRISGELVSGNYFSVVGATTQIGRPLTPEDERTPGSHPVAVISEAFWRRTFALDPSVLGRSIRLNDQTFTVIGVAARRFTGTDVGVPTDVWIPLSMQREVGRDFLTEARTMWLEVFGRLSSATPLEQAAAELTGYLDHRASEAGAASSGRRLILLPGATGNSDLIRRELGPALRVLMALSGLAMALACISVANLLTLRSAAREKETAVRMALGAGRARLMQQFLTETFLLAAMAGAAALVVAPSAARLVVAAQPYELEIDTSVNIRILFFAMAMSSLSAVCVALAPIFGSRHVALATSPGGLTSGARHPRLRDVVVTLQIAMSVAMLITAGLLLQSLRGLKSIDTGFRADDLLLISLDPADAGYEGERLERFWRDALDRISRVHGVRSVSFAGTVPFAYGRQRQPWVNPVSGQPIEIDTNFVGPHYFRTLGVPVTAGREFTERDGKASRRVAIINESLAWMFWSQQDPLGKPLRMGSHDAEVVGVVRDVKYRDLRGNAAPMVYRPLLQTGSSDAMTLHVRADADPSALVWTIRREMQILDANVPLFAISTLEDQLDASFAQTRQAGRLSGVFGVLALLLSAIGVYGVTAFAISRRTRELGVRVALGASRGHILTLIIRRGLVLTFAGLVLGTMGATGFAQVAEVLLFGVTAATSPTTYLVVASVAVVSLIGCCIPLRAAIKLDVAEAVRSE